MKPPEQDRHDSEGLERTYAALSRLWQRNRPEDVPAGLLDKVLARIAEGGRPVRTRRVLRWQRNLSQVAGIAAALLLVATMHLGWPGGGGLSFDRSDELLLVESREAAFSEVFDGTLAGLDELVAEDADFELLPMDGDLLALSLDLDRQLEEAESF